MRLEGTLDAFSLPDIFTLLSSTRKTGTLHVRRPPGRHGVVHLREGAVTGGRAQVERQELGRRLVGAGLVDDATLDKAVERLAHKPGVGLGRMLADTATLDAETLQRVACEQVVDAVFDLLRWTEGEFAFVVDEGNPDDLGAALPVDALVEEARRRLEAWPQLAAVVPAPDAVVCVLPAPPGEPAVAAGEWWLLALVDGRRTVGELVVLSGRGEFAVVSALAGLVQRSLVAVRSADDEALSSLQRRQALLGGLEGRADGEPPAPSTPVPPPVEAAASPAAGPAAGAAAGAAVGAAPLAARPPVIPERPEPFVAPRQPEHAEPAYARSTTGSLHGALPGSVAGTVTGGGHGSVHGSAAMQPRPELPPDPVPVAPGLGIDPSVNKSLLLRLIAGVRGL